MAINSNSELENKNPARSQCSSKTSNLSSCRLIKINFAGKESCSSSRAQGLHNNDKKSPYFTNDKVQMLSRVTAKKVINKKPSVFMSSFPLAASVYKANSDEFKLRKRGTQKVKKSVLTLPNEPVPMPKTYTVSDLNDSEYFNAANDNVSNKPKKRRSNKRNKKYRVKEHAKGLCDRDARYCSQLNIDLDCSSSEILDFTGDGERISKMSYKSNNSVKASSYPHDVWAVLRNINKFPFRPSPPGSQNSVIPLRKRMPIIRKSNNSNDTHIIETCHTEEFAYISSFEVDNKTRESFSPSSSLDRVTVIDKQSEQNEIIEQFTRNLFGSNFNIGEKNKSNVNNKTRGKNKPWLRNTNKKITYINKKTDINRPLVSNKTKPSQLQPGNVVEDRNKQLLPKVTSKTSSIFKRSENCSDDSSIKESDSVCNDQENSFQKCLRFDDDKNILSNCPNTKVKAIKRNNDSTKQLKGITKVILNKGKEIVSPKVIELQRKPHLALTLPNSSIPKLSRFEIKRRLANQKFPIVILGKDQLTNRGIDVTNFETSQFDGLDKHIWSFMIQWSDDKRIGNSQDNQKKEIIKAKYPKLKNKINHCNDSSNVNDLSKHATISKKVECKKRKNNTLPTNNNEKQLLTEVSLNIPKYKPLFHLKNKMFHFLHKNPTTGKLSENDWNNKECAQTVQEDKQVGTFERSKNDNLNNKYPLISLHVKEALEKPVENKIVQKPYSSLRQSWSKGKWASDFIENIIKKIRTGVYYSVDYKENKNRICANEVYTQTEINTLKNAYCQNTIDLEFALKEEIKKDDPINAIPGFDKTLTTLKIETIGTNQIAVKHSVTNIVVHFDIQVLGEENNVNNTMKPMTYIPIHAKDNKEKVFKCNTSIMNAILPAELCSIIPTMMRNILDVENKLFLQPGTVEKIQPQPTAAISEFIEPETARLTIDSLLPGYLMSNKITETLNGRFQITSPYNKTGTRSELLCRVEIMDSIRTLFSNTPTFCQYYQPLVILHISIKISDMLIKKQEMSKIKNDCMALQLYERKKFSIVPYLGPFNITDFVKQIADRFNLIRRNKNIKITCNDLICRSTDGVSKPLLNPRCELDVIPLTENKIGVISLFNALTKNNQYNNGKVVHTLNIKTNIQETTKRVNLIESKRILQKSGPSKVLRKKSYVRFYRKCKSMSSISNYKCTPLNRVTNLEEFCQALGSNLFCNVLDGCLERKIMGSVKEMKNWTTDISPKQALLILLLTNKKDTPNLIRFRPILLQGIAVNRITKSDELDTEIEVIERENFHKLSQASDYQKTFDESSEKLLKSLLEKRKKLNPSYLRVMARYVGLGLLAPPKK